MSPAAEPTGRLVLLRHGETEWSRDGRHTGRTDVPPTAVTDDDLVEWDYGGYEGRTTSEIRDGLGDPGWSVFGEGVVPGDTPGETVEEVAARASRVLARVAEPLRRGDVALVAHGHLLRILTATYLRQEARFGAQLLLDAGAVCVLDHERGVPAVRSWNETAG